MNAQAPLAALLVGHASRLRTAAVTLAFALVLLAGASACGGIGTGSQASSVDRHCADLWMQNIVATAAVSGVFACQDASLQAQAQAFGVTDDNGVFQALSTGDGGTVKLIGSDGSKFYYAVTDQNGGYGVWVLHCDPDGKIAHFIHGTLN